MGPMSSTINKKEFAFRIYRIIEKGPLHQTGNCVEFEDFILATQGYENAEDFGQFLIKRKGKLTKLSIYSMATRKVRLIEVVPDDSWTDDKSVGLLGANVRYENYLNAHLKVFQVTKVLKNSQLFMADVKAQDDFIVAMKRIDGDIFSFNHYEKEPIEYFKEVIDRLENQSVDLFIYNKLQDNYRKVKFNIIKDKSGIILGGDISSGLNHSFPIRNLEITLDKASEKKELAVIAEDENEKLQTHEEAEESLLSRVETIHI